MTMLLNINSNLKRFYIVLFNVWYLLMANTTFAFTHSDTLRGSNGIGRNWWDVQYYDLHVTFDTATKSIHGSNLVFFTITSTPHDSLQLDLQDPMELDSVFITTSDKAIPVSFEKQKNVYWLKYPFRSFRTGLNVSFIAYYHGKPKQAKLPPWEGGFIWTKDSTGKPWIAVACQGLGASSWWPCKDYQGDEPDNGMNVNIIFPDSKENPQDLSIISNGKLIDSKFYAGENEWGKSCSWQVKNPINTYDVTFYIGDYIHWKDTVMGEKGVLSLDFYALKYNEERAHKQFEVVKPMIHCFEHWMGPYPFYEDGYKLVEAPYLGMEHQSAVAYGNKYKMGYQGKDRSNTGVGTLFDFIIIHESGHEWFGNNITAKDISDNWIHEGITTYSETLFAECQLGKEKAFEYCRGEWSNIRNDIPVIGQYGVNDAGSSDKYDKGAALMHMIRMIMHNDEKFRLMLRGMNETFYHSTVTTKEIELYINTFSGKDFTPLFDQYLRINNIPIMDYYIKNDVFNYHFSNVLAGFSLPMEVTDGVMTKRIEPSVEWKSIPWKGGGYNVTFSKDFLFTVKK